MQTHLKLTFHFLTIPFLLAVSKLNSDIQVVEETLGNNFAMFSKCITQMLVVIGIMIYISPILSGVTFGGILPLGIFTNFFKKWMRGIQWRISTQKGLMSNVSEESFTNIRTVKACANEDAEIKKFTKWNNEVLAAGRTKACHIAVYQLVMEVLMYSAMAAVIYVASLQYKNGDISLGKVTSFLFF